MISQRTIGRLSLYRRLLHDLPREGVENVYSHQLAARSGVTAAQVRRDLMVIGYSGSPKRGYNVARLIASIRSFLDTPGGERVALVGVGNLGQALLSYFCGRRPNLEIVAAFDRNPERTGRVINGCRCYPPTELENVIRGQHIHVAILAVPATEAQRVAEQLVALGVCGLLNFAPTPLRVPPQVFVEDIDLTMSLEKVVFFSRREPQQKDPTA